MINTVDVFSEFPQESPALEEDVLFEIVAECYTESEPEYTKIPTC